MKSKNISQCLIAVLLAVSGSIACGGNSAPGSSTTLSHSDPSGLQQMVGTQGIGAAYQFTSDHPVIEQAQRAHEMGAKMFKINVSNLGADYQSKLDILLQMPFDTFFFWWLPDSEIWKDGFFDPRERAKHENETYEFARYLLGSPHNANRKRTIFIGHWEGDWQLLPNYDPSGNPAEARITGMINWLNTRQKAIERARSEAGLQSNVKLFHYAEVNRVRDAMLSGKRRVVNAVLPNTNVDYVSYSAYDIQHGSLDDINKTLDYIKSYLPVKAGMGNNRVFVGEFGVPAIEMNFDGEKHKIENRDILIKFLKSGVPYILYWQMYNNEIEQDTNRQRGFWLIDDKNQKQPLYYALRTLYEKQKSFTDTRQESIQWLETLN